MDKWQYILSKPIKCTISRVNTNANCGLELLISYQYWFLRLNKCTISSVQFSRVQLFVTPMDCSTPGLPVPHHILEFAQVHAIESVTLSNHLTLCCPLLLLPSIFPSIRVFSNESVLHIRRPKYWSISFNINPSNEYSGLISFRMDWLDFHTVQGLNLSNEA